MGRSASLYQLAPKDRVQRDPPKDRVQRDLPKDRVQRDLTVYNKEKSWVWNPNILEAEAGRLGIQTQTGLHSKAPHIP